MMAAALPSADNCYWWPNLEFDNAQWLAGSCTYMGWQDCAEACQSNTYGRCEGLNWFEGSRVCCLSAAGVWGGLRFNYNPQGHAQWGKVWAKKRC